MQHTRVKHNGQIGEAETEEEILEIWKKHFGEIVNSESPDNVERERLLFEQNLAEEVERIKKPWWFVELCVVMPLHNGQVGSLPPSGRPPTRQVSPAGYMFPCSPLCDQ